MAPHRSTTDAVWRQAVRNDLHHNQGKFIGVLLADLKQCYEHVPHSLWWGEAQKCNFPAHVV
eukprot:9454232-Pyramimonas_sp.AAC.1